MLAFDVKNNFRPTLGKWDQVNEKKSSYDMHCLNQSHIVVFNIFEQFMFNTEI